MVQGVASKEHIHLQVSYPSSLSVSDLVRRLKGRSAKKLLEEFPELRRRYYGGHLWGIGYGAWSTGNITDAMILEYLEHHRSGPNGEQNFILEKLSVSFSLGFSIGFSRNSNGFSHPFNLWVFNP